ncbi:MAG: N-acetyltransferase [Gammaproteobacteria bacterium]|nr:N-acetyltransferase [Gammaproteobacteria bacterium]MDE2250517.1 N-acetyltransferase [Gammaproteobacteria bacterium]
MPATVRPARAADAAALAAIYNPYVTGTIITFEEQPVDAVEMSARLAATAAARLPWLVAEDPLGVRGYAYASSWKSRAAYRHTVEVTVYLESAAFGRGLGTRLYTALFGELRRAGCHTVLGGVALPNEASVALHEKLGMRKVGELREVGYKLGRWINVGYWQLTFG